MGHLSKKYDNLAGSVTSYMSRTRELEDNVKVLQVGVAELMLKGMLPLETLCPFTYHNQSVEIC
jgi:hypothetical protein